jgi:hypothetical protein
MRYFISYIYGRHCFANAEFNCKKIKSIKDVMRIARLLEKEDNMGGVVILNYIELR